MIAQAKRPTSRCRETDKLIKIAWKAGWRMQARNGHIKMQAPDGKTTVVASGSPSDHRGVKNLRAQLRRGGLRV
jgi:hypothetical protein